MSRCIFLIWSRRTNNHVLSTNHCNLNLKQRYFMCWTKRRSQNAKLPVILESKKLEIERNCYLNWNNAYMMSLNLKTMSRTEDRIVMLNFFSLWAKKLKTRKENIMKLANFIEARNISTSSCVFHYWLDLARQSCGVMSINSFIYN